MQVMVMIVFSVGMAMTRYLTEVEMIRCLVMTVTMYCLAQWEMIFSMGGLGNDHLIDDNGDDTLDGGDDSDLCYDKYGNNKFKQCEIKN